MVRIEKDDDRDLPNFIFRLSLRVTQRVPLSIFPNEANIEVEKLTVKFEIDSGECQIFSATLRHMASLEMIPD